MRLDIKFKSIAVKWFINIFLVVAIVICAVAFAFSVLFNSIQTERIEGLATDYAYEFSALSGANKQTFKDSAINIASSFQYKNSIEVQVLSKDGELLVSTSGFETVNDSMPDYLLAKETGATAIERFSGAGGEQVMAGTTPIFDSKGKELGAYRWITSMESANKSTMWFVVIMVVAAFGILAFFGISGLYFIKSIVKPIRDVSNMARKIAMGDFKARIDINKDDEIGELCDNINYMASELSLAENLKNDFISSVSHELRTPLTAIRGWGETAKMSVGMDEELVNRGLEVVLSEADRLSGLVEELLDFSRMANGKMTVETKPINITMLLSESVDMYFELCKNQGIDLTFTSPSEEIEIMGDVNRLKQVFINIIDNAVKYTESGGQVLVTQLREEGCVRISVTDTGIGIPGQDLDRIKEKFYKASNSVRGSGIGLAVADEIIKHHDGLLFVESTEGVGTTVTIVLPIYQRPPEEEMITLEEAVGLEEAEKTEQTETEQEENVQTEETKTEPAKELKELSDEQM